MKRTILTIVMLFAVLTAAYSQDVSVAETLAQINEKNMAIASSPRNAELYYQRGRLYFMLEQYEEALEDFNRAIALDPENAEYYFYKSIVCYQGLGRYNEALDAVNATIGYDPDPDELVGYLFFRGAIYNDMGKFQEAVDDLTMVIDSGVNALSVYLLRSQAYINMKKLDEAIDDLTKEIDTYQENQFIALTIRSRTYREQKKFDKALADINRLWEVAPNEPQYHSIIYSHRAYFYLETGKLQEALRDANWAVELSPQSPELYRDRAEVYEKLAASTRNRRRKAEYLRLAEADRAIQRRLEITP